MSASDPNKPHAQVLLTQQVRCLPSDTDTPISLFLRLAGKDGSFLLESAEVDGRWGRYSVLGCDLALVLSCRAGKLAVEARDERLSPLTDYSGLPFLDGLRAVMRRLELRQENAELTLPAITRGLFGYFGYGTAALFHPKLAKAGVAPADAEACLVLPSTLLLMDHLYNKLFQISLNRHRDVDAGHPLAPQAGAEVGGQPQPSLTQEAYEAGVRRIKDKLHAGEGIQVVLSSRMQTPFTGDPFTLYRRMRRKNPSPYMFYLDFPGITLFGSSPEVMVRCTDGELQLSPIAGSRRRGRDDVEDATLAAELLQDPKERSEHVMLVDLGRNDLGRVAVPGSVKVERLMEVERFSHIMHLTSRVTARAGASVDAVDILAATFPAGTVSGAPKIRAMEIIQEIEQTPRGPYAGCVGWIGLDHGAVNLDTGIVIRSMWVRDGTLYWQAGAGIVHDSVPETEWKECQTKAAIMRAVIASDPDADPQPAQAATAAATVKE